MKKVFYTFFALLFVSPLFGRVICDTTCHAPEDEFRHFAVVSPVGRSMVTPIGDFNMRELPSGTYLIRISGLKGACKVLNTH